MDILLHFTAPKLEYFSKKQLNQNYLQMDAIGGPAYLTLVSTLLQRGDSPFAQVFFLGFIWFLEHKRLCESLNGLLLVSLQICTIGGCD